MDRRWSNRCLWQLGECSNRSILDSTLKIGTERLSEPLNKVVIGGCGGCELEDLTCAEQDESCTLLESLRFGEHQKNISADRIQSLSSERIVSGTIG